MLRTHCRKLILEEAWMTELARSRTPQQVEELTSAIREMANRVKANFIQDDQKIQNFIAACAEREKLSSAR